MAKDKSEKKEKKEKKEKRQSVDGVKKEKKEKRKSTDATTALLNTIEDAQPGAVAVDADGDVIVDGAATNGTVVKAEDDKKIDIPISPLVPFANPLCDEKSGKKVLKTVKKGKTAVVVRPIWTSTNIAIHSCKAKVPKARSERSSQSCPQNASLESGDRQ